MSEFLEMRSFVKNERVPTVEKVIRDGQNMYNSSRYVIVLNNNGEVIETINGKHGFIGNFLVVLAPVTYKGVSIPMSVVLEIGIGRATPYQQFEQWNNDERTTIKGRKPVAKMKDAFVIKLLPLLSKTLQSIVDQDISHRSVLAIVVKKATSIRNSVIKTRGLFIRINKEEEIICYACLARDIETRSHHHVDRFVTNTIKRLASLIGKSDYYTDKELAKKSTASEIAYYVNESGYPTHMMEIVREKIIKRDNKSKQYLELFEQILRVFKIKILDTEVDDQKFYVELNKKLGNEKEKLLSNFSVLIGVDVKRTSKRKKSREAENKNPEHEQAKNCIIVEVKPSRELLLARGELREHEFHT